jgi:hypothetical protein
VTEGVGGDFRSTKQRREERHKRKWVPQQKQPKGLATTREAIHIILGRRITLVDYRSHIERGKI